MANSSPLPMRARLDRLGVVLSGVCAVHCVLGLVVVAGLGLSGGLLLAPEIHEVGLVLAALVAAAAIGLRALRHPLSARKLVIALIGLACMGAALLVGHGVEEAVLTLSGVTLVAIGHLMNMRAPMPRNLPGA